MLAAEDNEYIKTPLPTWLTEQAWNKPPTVYEIELRERMMREEPLQNRGDGLSTQHVDSIHQGIDRRFEQIGKHVELLREEFSKRLEQTDKRFEPVDKRLEQSDKQFEQADKRFEQIHQEILQIHRDIRQLIRREIGMFIAIGGLPPAALRFL